MTLAAKIAVCLALIAMMVACTPSGNSRPVYSEASNPKAAELNMRLGLNYLQRGDFKIALEKLQKSLQQDPNLASAHNTIALLFQQLGEMDKAEKHFKQAVSLQKGYSSAHNNYGVYLCQQGQYLAAEQQFLIAIDDPLYSNTAKAYENAGLCINKIPDPILAEKYFRKALQLAPNLNKSLINMAKLSYLNVDYQQAKDYISRYRQLGQWTPQALLTAIQVSQRLNEHDEVASYSLLLRAQFPDSDEAHDIIKGRLQ